MADFDAFNTEAPAEEFGTQQTQSGEADPYAAFGSGMSGGSAGAFNFADQPVDNSALRYEFLIFLYFLYHLRGVSVRVDV